MENAIFPSQEPPADFSKTAIPVRMGLLIAFISIFISTIANLYLVSNMIPYFAVVSLGAILTIILLGVTGSRQKKAMGGYISIKEAFSAIFISIIIIVVLTTLYSYIYMHFIDPNLQVKLKEATLAFSEKMGAPQSKLDDAAKNFDEKMEQSKKISNQLLSVAWGIVIYSIFGFICAAIVKKDRPDTMR